MMMMMDGMPAHFACLLPFFFFSFFHFKKVLERVGAYNFKKWQGSPLSMSPQSQALFLPQESEPSQRKMMGMVGWVVPPS